MKLGIYKFDWDCNYGSVYGIFIEECENVKLLENSNISVNFGEILGKHSEVDINIKPGDFILVTDNKDEIDLIKNLKLLPMGYNPFDYKLGIFSSIPNSLRSKYNLDWDKLSIRNYIELLKKNK